MMRRGHPEAAIRKVVYDNPLAFWRQCARWQEWEDASKETAADGQRAGAGPHAKEAFAGARR
jgi:hypothetical protein